MAIPHANDTQSPACTRKQAYTFEGVDCPVCAAKIEDRIQKIGGVASVCVDFSRKQIRITTEEKQQDSFYNNLIKEAKRVEPSLRVKLAILHTGQDRSIDTRFWCSHVL